MVGYKKGKGWRGRGYFHTTERKTTMPFGRSAKDQKGALVGWLISGPRIQDKEPKQE